MERRVRALPRGGVAAVCTLHLRSLLQLVDAVGHDHVAGREPLSIATTSPCVALHRHRAHLDRLVRLDDVDERALLAALQPGRRHQNRFGIVLTSSRALTN